MGTKGARLSAQATALAERVVGKMKTLGDVNAKKMFGGYGLFHEEKMFGLISSEASMYFRVTELNNARYKAIEAEKYGKMPYYLVPEKIIDNPKDLVEWADEAIKASKSA